MIKRRRGVVESGGGAEVRVRRAVEGGGGRPIECSEEKHRWERTDFNLVVHDFILGGVDLSDHHRLDLRERARKREGKRRGECGGRWEREGGRGEREREGGGGGEREGI
jgi:hypothetical protein